jgi:hypothetical protein
VPADGGGRGSADYNDESLALRSIERSRALNPGLMSYARWLEENGARIPRP